MKKALVGILLLVLLLTGCTPSNRRLGEVMLNEFSNDENYVTLIGEIIEYDSSINYITIKSEGLKDYLAYDTCVYTIFSQETYAFAIGDTIEFTTIIFHIYGGRELPIVGIKMNDATLLTFEDGKAAIIKYAQTLYESKHPYRLSKEDFN